MIAGIPACEIDSWTWGEVLTQITADRERQRRRNQERSVIAVGGAQYLAAYLGGDKVPELYEVFPFWSTEEENRMKVAKYRRMMERMAGRSDRHG